MKTVTLVLGIHNHQPVGNFDSIFEQAYQHAYLPFLDVLERHPHVKLSQHYTGILLEWLQENHPEFIERLSALVSEGRVELMTGAFYEAILPSIPDIDKRLQIQKLTERIHLLFNVTPKGMWLAERVWEPFLAKPIAEAGVKFIAVDDSHFKSAGLTEEELLGYYVTEEQGSMLNVFPISKRLRYAIPFQPVDVTINYLRSVASEDDHTVVVFADDGEKFGVWPSTFKHVYENEWLDQFFSVLDENSEWIHLRHFSEVVETIPPRGRVYLPNASYAEMMHWALPPKAFVVYEEFEKFLEQSPRGEDFQRFFRGGFWRNFLSKYPEANNMHKKMLRISRTIHDIEQKRGSSVYLRAALDHLLAAQCNDAYWHGVFGGLYLPNLRFPIYHHLLEAEYMIDARLKRRGYRSEFTDFDCDGHKELLIESELLNAYFKPHSGGALFELDDKRVGYNVLDIVSRHEEGYHQKLRHGIEDPPSVHAVTDSTVASIHDLLLTKESGLERFLHYDWYQHGSFIDHFFGERFTIENFAEARYPEQGDFVNQPYSVAVKKKRDGLAVTLERTGGVWAFDQWKPIRVRKLLTFRHGSASIGANYELENLSGEPIEVWFGIEFSFGFLTGDAPDRYFEFDNLQLEDRRLRSSGIVEQSQRAAVVDEWLGIRAEVALEKPTSWFRVPIETVSLSEAGFERLYQGTIVVPNWKLRIEKKHNLRIVLSLTKLR